MYKYLLLLVMTAVAHHSVAAPVTYQFSGTTSSGAMSTATGSIPVNTPYTGSFTYDDAQLANPVAFYGGTHATYTYTDISLTIGSTTITDGPGNIDIYDNVNPPNGIPVGDSIYINLSSLTPPSGPINGVQFGWIFLGFVDYSGTALTSSALPATINLASFQNPTFYDSFIEFNFGPTSMLHPLGSLSQSTSTVATPPTITTVSLPNGVYNTPYNASIAATAANGNQTTLAITPASLPAGLSFNGSSIVGTPTVVGVFNVAITATDVNTKLSSSVTLPLTINDAAISFNATVLPDAVINSGYSATVTAATGGTGSFSYTTTGLPAGLTLTGTTLAGTAPATAGLYPFTLTATDTAGGSVSANLTLNVITPAPVACSGSNAVESAYVPRKPGFIVVNGGLNLLDHLWTTNLTPSTVTFLGGLVNWYQTGLIISWNGVVDTSGCILSNLTVAPAISISTTALPNATVNSTYSAPISAAWGVTPYKSFTVSGQPAGLTMVGTNLTGTPTAAPGSYPIIVTAIDATGATASKTLTLVIVDQAINFAPALPSATVGSFYSANLAASGGYGSFTYTASAALPAGLNLSGNTISGTPASAGSSSLTLTATDAAGSAANALVTLTINPAPVVTSCTVPKGATGGLNSQGSITAINGNLVTFITRKGVSVSVTVPACAKIQWNGGAKAFAIGQNFEWNGYSSSVTGNVAQQVTIN